jgi:ankyrin repeat protein
MKWQLLHQACWAGDRAEVERLLASGANPNQQAPTNWRQTPLGRTLEFRITHPKHAGHTQVVQALLDGGADATVRSTYLDMTPYELACFCGLQPAADLLRASQSAACPHPSGMSGLWLAAASRLPEPGILPEVARLVTAGDVNTIWRDATPLMMAAGHAAHFAVADLLLEAGADPNAGVSILHAACDWHFQYLVPALGYLARSGWDVNARDAQGQTALHKAAFLGYAAAVRTLLTHGADPAMRDFASLTPMDLARKWKKLAALKVLARAS